MQLTGRPRAPCGAAFSLFLFLSSAVSHAQSPQQAAAAQVSGTPETNQTIPAPSGGPRDGIAVAHGPTPAPRPDMHTDEYRGTGRIITGKVITSVGGVYTGLGIIALAMSLGSGSDDGIPIGVSAITWGAVHLAVGIPLLIAGKRARERYDMRMGTLGRSRRPSLTPLAVPLPGGFTAGFALAF